MLTKYKSDQQEMQGPCERAKTILAGLDAEWRSIEAQLEETKTEVSDRVTSDKVMRTCFLVSDCFKISASFSSAKARSAGSHGRHWGAKDKPIAERTSASRGRQ